MFNIGFLNSRRKYGNVLNNMSVRCFLLICGG
nr:MAG TPA: hypothetical protein [Caudoviricetes sp.]